MELKRVPLHEVHQALGAKMVPFAGYEMPVRYSGDLEEHHTVRKQVGIFDVSHMGEFFVKGPQAQALIQQVTSNDVSVLQDGQAQYSCLPNAQGGIVDDLIVYRIHAEEYMLVVNASNIEKDWQWISQHNTMGAVMENASDSISLFAVQGPLATQAIQSLTEVNLNDLAYYTFTQGTFAGVENVIISATGYTGSGGFELYVPAPHAVQVWEAILKAGQPQGIKPIGLGARDTLRLEMGYCLYGNDITDTTSPLEAALAWITKLDTQFVGRDVIAAQKEAGTTRRLTAIQLEEKGVPRAGYTVLNEQGQEVGTISSGTQSPSLGIGIALAYVNKPFNKIGTPLKVAVRKRELAAKVVKLPFFKPA